ncbi:MAG: sodium-dependent transporter [Bacillus sp. (in: Bacteria)]|nr:sodium-dependent transporter [Bacillus sp. (in: firmicutes)]
MLQQKDSGSGLSNREQWVSRNGFILAAVGSAVGLGNIWGFSFALGTQGGAAFLLIYLICIVFVGYPLMMAEFTIGRKAQSDTVGSFQKLAPGKPWFFAGIFGVIASFLIMAFYPVIGAWVLKYIQVYLFGGIGATASGDFFGAFTTSNEVFIWHLLFMGFTLGIVILGVKSGIEKANKILLPALAIMILGLAVFALTQNGASEGLAFMFSPTWASFTNSGVWLAAMGQAFFSLSLGMGALITYASYLKKEDQLPKAAGTVVTLDTLIAVMAGVMIFPAVFAFGLDPAGGGGLVFVTMPNVFESMTGGIIFGLVFYVLLAFAAISSAVSLLEVPVAYFMNKFQITRKLSTLIVGGIMFVTGLPIAFNLFGWYNVDNVYGLAASFFLPLGGLIISLFVGWGWSKNEVLKDSDFGQSTIGQVWIFLLKFVIPVLITVLFIQKAMEYLGF